MAETIAKQLHRPFESPYEDLVNPSPPAAVFGPKPVTTGGTSFRIGRFRIDIPGVLGTSIDRPVDYGLRLAKSRDFVGIINGGIQEVDASMPVFFHKPDRSDSIDVRLIRNKVVSVNYTDYFDKHPNLRGPYELTITLEFLAQIPEVEQLADADVRRRIYEDLYLSDLSHMIVDTEKYINDPNYSAASDTESRLKRENVVGKSGYIETTLTVK